MLNQLNIMGNCMGKKGKASHQVTLAILGLDNAGKTVTTKGLQGEPLDTVAPTVGFSSVEFRFEKTDITLFDLGGGKKIRDIWKNYFSEVYGVIYVIDSSEPERLDECASVLQGLVEHPKVAGKPVLVLANKQDVKGAMDDRDIIEGLRLEELVNMHKCPCRLEMCSAVVGQGKKLDRSIRNGMHWLLSYIKEEWLDLDERVEADVAEQREREKQDKKERAERVRKIREEREMKEKAERLARGEPEEGEEEEEENEEDFVDGGGPFKQLDYNQLKLKIAEMTQVFHLDEQELKEEKRRKKEEEKRQKENDNEDNHSDSQSARKSRRSRRKLNIKDDGGDREGEEEGEGEQEEPPRPSQYSMYLQSISDGASFSVNSNNSRDRVGAAASPIESSRPSDEEEELGGLGSRWKQRQMKGKGTPRPEDLGAPTKRGGALAPIGHVGHLEPLENVAASSKKKKKKKARKNQTVPAMSGDADDYAPKGWPSSSMSRASRSPDLNTTKEEEQEEEEDLSKKWGLLNDDLVEDDMASTTSAGPRRSRPNSEYDDEIVT